MKTPYILVLAINTIDKLKNTRDGCGKSGKRGEHGDGKDVKFT